MIKGIIFDMDGLMIDSERTTYNCYVDKLKTLGYDYNEELYKLCLGKKKPGICQTFIDAFPGIDIDEVWDDVHVELDKRLLSDVPLKKGLIELLEYLKDNNYKTIVATSSERHRVDKILDKAGIHKYFDDTICGNEVTNGKPNPEIFIKGCQKIDVGVDEVIVLEDSEAGIQAAVNGKMKVICIPDMKYPEEKYASECTKILDSLLDVIDYLKQNK
ncbi:MAG: HAD family phosphatase [Thomasclavelia sp.]|jgi:HAD superfamily hydrolase (TIGR01509 family)|nr:HAD family phosphatase [Thomasclavelia sp.]